MTKLRVQSLSETCLDLRQIQTGFTSGLNPGGVTQLDKAPTNEGRFKIHIRTKVGLAQVCQDLRQIGRQQD